MPFAPPPRAGLRALLVLALAALAPGVLALGLADSAAAQTGRLSGRVVDAATGDAIPGANVFLLGTERGGTTDLDGYYNVLNIPPGTYSVRYSFVGYQTQVLEDVRINIDQTTTLNVRLSETGVGALGEVVVRAERPVVERDVSNSRVNVSAEEIRAVPAASVAGVIGLQAGIQGLSVRGSGSDELAFQVNGLTLRDERNNAPFTNIALSSVQEVQVQTGGFNAEYGNVRSGVVNVVTREGSRTRYEGAGALRLRPPGPKHFGMLANDPNSYWIRPYLDPEVAYTGTQNWDPVTQMQYPAFEGWNAVAARLQANGNPDDDMTPDALMEAFRWQHRKSFEITQPDYDVDLGFGGPVPGLSRALGDLRFFGSYRRERNMLMIPLHTRSYDQESGHLKLTLNPFTGAKVNLEGRLGLSSGTAASRSGQPGFFQSPASIASNLTQVSFIDSRLFSTDYWNPLRVRYNQVGGSLNYSISPTSFAEVRLNRFESRYLAGPGRRRDPSPAVIIGGVPFDEGPFGYQPFPADGVNGLRMGVGMSNSRDSSRVAVYNLQADYTSQLTRFLEVKTGIEYNLTRSRANYAQIDSFLTGGNFRVLWDRSPVRGAAYGQSRLEFQGMIANLGLRLDYAHAGGEWYEFDAFDQRFAGVPIVGGDPTPGLNELFVTRPTSRIVTLSPRLGVSFPITIVSKLYFNYGHFRSMPDPDDLYLVRAFSSTGQINRIASPNNPLPKTVAYEIGYEQSFLDQFLARIAGYYKDVTLEPRTVTYNSRNGAVSYALSEPNFYRDLRGFEFTFSRNRGQWLRGFVNYTYQVSRLGSFGLPSIFENTTTQRQQEESDAVRRAAQSRPVPRPFGRLNLDFFSPRGFGPVVGGFAPLAEWRASLIGRWQDGGRFTWGDNGVAPPGVVNNVDVVDSWSFDLRFARDFTVRGRSATFFADVFNLTNRRELSLFYGAVDGNDRNAYLTSLHLPASPDYTNIPGRDRVGTYRPDNVPFQPMRSIGTRAEVNAPNDYTIYYERETQGWLVFQNGQWQTADQGRVNEVLRTKAYIDMPNQQFLNFLNPRNVFFGVRVNF
ncbi:MAG: TonB-dependent receptor [Rubricoccaceae bacterium]